jgi:ABC-type multidrug transport system fused ATPase/permease subunit
MVSKYIKDISKYLLREHKLNLFIILVLPVLNSYFVAAFFPKFNALLNNFLALNDGNAKLILNKLIIATLSIQVIRYLQRYFLTIFLSKINFDLKSISMWKFLNLPLNTYNIEKHSGKINKLTSNVVDFIHTGITLIYKAFFTSVIGIITMIYLNKTIGKLFLVFTIVFIMIFPKIFNKAVINSYSSTKEETNINIFIEDISRNFFFEKLFILKDFTYDLFLKLLNKETMFVKKKYSSLGVALFQSNLIIAVTSSICSLITVYFLDISGKEKILVVGLINAFFMNFNEIPMCIIPLFNNLGGIKENLELFNLTDEIEKPVLELEITDVEIKNIYFSYNSEKKILENLNLKFTKGLNIIEGESGKGKTTLIKIITGLMEATSGEVLFNGINIKDKNILSNISYMPQFDGIYNRSVINNINLKKDSLEIFDKIKEFKMLEILNNNCGINGQNISGGENRRISLLRMLNFYKVGNLMIFDEPFVGLHTSLIDFMISFILSFKDNHVVLIIDHTHLLRDLKPNIFYL